MSLVLPSGLDKATRAQLEAIAPYPEQCVQVFFKIKNRLGNMVYLHYNRSQRLAAERATRFNFYLKARKLGLSTRRIALDLWKCATRRKEHRILLTQPGDQDQKMMAERVKPMVEHCMFPLGAVWKSWGYYFPLTESRYYVATAGSKKYGRGSDLTGWHFTEYAHWPDKDVQAGVEEGAVEGAEGDIETTANAMNFAKVLWDLAKLNKSRYRAIFLPWYADEEYALPGVSLERYDEEEEKLVEAFGLTMPQLAWRRSKLGRMGDTSMYPTHAQAMDDAGLFPQEFPATDDEAFLTSGRLVFDWLALVRHKDKLKDPVWVGDLVDRGDRIDMVPNPHGKLKVWKVPEPGHVYAIGGDVAEGLPDGAFSAGEVIDLGDSEQVAEWHGHIDPTLFGDVLNLLGKWYNWAMLVPEGWPGPGGVTLARLEALRYPKLWEDMVNKKDCWHTTSKSKPLAIAELNTALRDLRTAVHGKDLHQELSGYVYAENGEMVPSLGAYSDRLMAYAIGWYASRDLATRVDYYRAPRMERDEGRLLSGATSVPRFTGPRLGRRRE